MKKMTDTEIRESFLDAASRLFALYGFNKTTMEEIAKAIGKSKATLYYYYASKEDVLMDLFNREAKSIFQKISSAIESGISAYEQLEIYFRIVAKEAEKVVNLYNICRFELKGNFQIQQRMKEIYNDKHISLLKEIISYGVTLGEFHKFTTEEIDEVVNLIDSILLNFIIFELIEKQNLNWQKSFTLLGNIINKGLR